MALKVRFVDRYILDADPVLVGSRFNDAVNQQKRVAMRQQREKLLNVVALKHSLGRFVHFAPLSVWRIGTHGLVRFAVAAEFSGGELLHGGDFAKKFANGFSRRAAP